MSHDSPRVAVEAPTYDRMVSLLQRLGAEVVSLLRTRDGIDIDGLRHACTGRHPPDFLYVLPTFHNPTGLTMSAGQRRQLVELAVERGLVIVEDDPYGLLRVDGEPVTPLHDLLNAAGAGHLAVHLSSFSKTVAPGLRVGYVVAPPALVARLRELATEAYISPPMLAQAQLYEYLRGGYLEPHLEELRAFLRPRRDALLDAFERRMPAGARWTRPDGGYFLWLELPEGMEADALAQRSAAAGVTIVPGTGFFAGRGGAAGARLSFSFPPVAEVRAGGERLAELVAAA
jgi:DNA-binding transcriptional MocR family regulator